MKRVLIIYGGYAPHEPKETTEIIKAELEKNDCKVTITDNLGELESPELAENYDLISIHITMSEISKDQMKNLSAAVKSGVGFAGYHGGAGDAFRSNTTFQTMVGGQFVGHPYVGKYRVYIDGEHHPVTDGMADFDVIPTELYYMHYDPAVTVLATCRAGELANIVMPVAWVKSYGSGKVYYNALGHDHNVVNQDEIKDFIVKGMLWAAR